MCISEIALMGKKAVHVELLYLVFLGTSTMNMIHVLEDMRSQTRYCEFSANSSRTFNCTVNLHQYLYPKDNHTLAQVYQPQRNFIFTGTSLPENQAKINISLSLKI